MTLLASAFLLGILGGLHCLAMCGAFVLAMHAGSGERSAASPRGLHTIWLHAGRLITYATLGGVAGGVGAMARWMGDLHVVQSAMFFLANITLLGMAFYALRGFAGIPVLERAGAQIARAVHTERWLGSALGKPGWGSMRPMLAGLIWGFVPCGLIYTALTLALLSGSAPAGALVMAALWVGTVPSLAATGWVLARAGSRFSPQRIQRAIGVVLLALSVIGLYRVFFAPHSAALAALCRLP